MGGSAVVVTYKFRQRYGVADRFYINVIVKVIPYSRQQIRLKLLEHGLVKSKIFVTNQQLLVLLIVFTTTIYIFRVQRKAGLPLDIPFVLVGIDVITKGD